MSAVTEKTLVLADKTPVIEAFGNVKRIAVIGVGPHALETYVNRSQSTSYKISLLIDLQSQATRVKSSVAENFAVENVEMLFLPDEENFLTSAEAKQTVRQALVKRNITHAIVATEAGWHLFYVLMLLESGICVLTDKPLSAARVNSTNRWIEEDRDIVLKAIRTFGSQCYLMLPRSVHPIYNRFLSDVYLAMCIAGAPIHNIHIVHDAGVIYHGSEYERDNHPYKYGYGKLFHSGVHLIYVLADLIQAVTRFCGHHSVEVSFAATSRTPSDNEAAFCDVYSDLFGNKHIDPSCLVGFGETDAELLFKLVANDRLLTSGSIILRNTSVSAREFRNWPDDSYKQGGRINRETVTCTLGHLFEAKLTRSKLTRELTYETLVNPVWQGQTSFTTGLDIHSSSFSSSKRSIVEHWLSGRRSPASISELSFGFSLLMMVADTIGESFESDGIATTNWSMFMENRDAKECCWSSVRR